MTSDEESSIAADVTFIAPASKLYVSTEVLAGCDFDAAVPVDYVAQRDADKTPDRRGRYRVLEDRWTMPPPKNRKGSGLELRRVFVWSSGRRRGPHTKRGPRSWNAPATTSMR